MHCQITGRKERERGEWRCRWPDCDIGRRIVEFHRGRIPSARRATRGIRGIRGTKAPRIPSVCVYSTLNASRSSLLFVRTNDSLNGKSINLDGDSILPSANEKFRSFSFSPKPPFRGDRSVSDRDRGGFESLLESTRGSGMRERTRTAVHMAARSIDILFNDTLITA